MPRARWLHVGDNEHSDIQAACDRRIPYLHVAHPARSSRRVGSCGTKAISRGRGRQIWSSDTPCDALPEPVPRPGRPLPVARLGPRLGYVVFGPLMLLFMSWLIRHEALGRVERLYFPRAGRRLPGQVLPADPGALGLRHLPEGRYFHVSRQVAIGAALGTGFRPDLVTGAGRYVGSIQPCSGTGRASPPRHISDWTAATCGFRPMPQSSSAS